MTGPFPGFLNLDGRVAVVTGAGSGIGRAASRLLARAGARVAIGQHRTGGDDAVSEIRAEGGVADAFPLELVSEKSVQGFCQGVVGRFGKVDILVNVAAIYPMQGLLEITQEQWDHVQAVNLRGTLFMMREAIRLMRDAGGGAILNVASIDGDRPAILGHPAYAASKAGVINLTRNAALDFAADGIRVNAVLPGYVATEGAAATAVAMREANVSARGPLLLEGRSPLEGVTTPEDVAHAILFFCSAASQAITGQTLVIDRGFMVS